LGSIADGTTSVGCIGEAVLSGTSSLVDRWRSDDGFRKRESASIASDGSRWSVTSLPLTPEARETEDDRAVLLFNLGSRIGDDPIVSFGV
jgi:hypothetical protein